MELMYAFFDLIHTEMAGTGAWICSYQSRGSSTFEQLSAH